MTAKQATVESEPGEALVEACEERFRKLDPRWQAHLDDTAREGEQAPAPKLTEA